MKPPRKTIVCWFEKSVRFPISGVIGLCVTLSAWPAAVRSESVDSEIVLLVDIVQPELSNTNFTRLLNGYADTFSSSQMLSSIQSGTAGKIAVSMMLFGGTTMQLVGIPWMVISNAAEAQDFATAVRNVTRPTTFAFSNPATALAAAKNLFGTETGRTANGFESAVQVIEVATAGIPSNSMATAAANSSANALASGVDIINTLALGTFSNSINTFYSANVIGSTIPGVTASTTTAPLNGNLGNTMNLLLGETVQTGATVSIGVIPEPVSIAALLPAAMILLGRRRR